MELRNDHHLNTTVNKITKRYLNYINFIMIKTKFETASDAFNYFFPKIMWDGVKFDNTNGFI